MDLKFGPLTSKLLVPFPWTDGYPSWQEWADELERLLSFADSQRRLSSFLPRLKTDRHTQRDAAQSLAKLDEWGVNRNAATVFGRVLSYLRDEDFLRHQTVNGYPAVVSENPWSNPAVRIAKADVLFDGETITTMPLTGFPSIGIMQGVWNRVCERLERGEDVPAYRSFLLDAYYFATSGDPLRAVIMASAAWETALRQFILFSGTKNPGSIGLPKLRELAEEIKDRSLFDGHDVEMRKILTKALVRLPRLRNKLLHEGKKDLAREDVIGATMAVDEGIGWLFGSTGGARNQYAP